MQAPEAIERVTRTLEVCAERHGDIVPEVYERFFARSASGYELMSHSDEHMRGRMFEEVLGLLMSDESFAPEGYLDWELKNHLDAYNATREMYEAFFAAVTQVVREALDADWTAQDDAAWQQRTDQVLAHVDAHAPG